MRKTLFEDEIHFVKGSIINIQLVKDECWKVFLP